MNTGTNRGKHGESKGFARIMSDKNTEKIRKQSHHKKNFIIEYGCKTGTTKRILLNALDSKNAIRIGLNRICKEYPQEEITRARVARVYDNTIKRIEKRIG